MPLHFALVVVLRATPTAVIDKHSRKTEDAHCVSENDTDVAHYNFNSRQPILAIFGRNVVERVHYQKVICYPTPPN